MTHSSNKRSVVKLKTTKLLLLTILFSCFSPPTEAYRCIGGEAWGSGYEYQWWYAGYASSGNPCPAGQYNQGCGYGCDYSPAGSYVSSSGATSYYSCSSGQYSGRGENGCNSRPGGYVLTHTSGTPYPCDPGFYENGGTCYVCPAGYICGGGSQWYSTVSSPYYSEQGMAYKMITPPGHKLQSSSLPPIPCAETGYYWNGASCSQCSWGYACPDSESSSQIPCTAGFYSPQNGLGECLACPAGHYCPQSGGLYRYVYECSSGTYSLGYQDSCTSCPAGYYCPSPHQAPVLCQRGTTSTGGALRCSANIDHLSDNIASGQVATSSYCSAGYYYVYNSTDAITRCNPCPRGHYCSSKTSMPTPCSSGYYQDQEAQTSCTQCPAGSACPFPHRSPVACPLTASNNGVEGYTSSAGSTSCYPVYGSCSSGYYKYPNPMQTETICPEGYACNNGNCFSPPQLCPRGYYSAAGATACTLCEAGYKCPMPYASMREACSSGYYSAAGSLNCYPVPSHMFTDTSKSTNIRPIYCEYGQYSKIATNECITCPADKWCPHDNYDPLDCDMQVDASSTSFATSRAAENNCFAKTATRGGGSYTSQEFDTFVAAGSFAQIGGTVQYQCPQGRECLFPMENIFVQCPPGYYDPDGKFSCQPCPEGRVCPIMTHQYIENNNGGWVMDGFYSPYGTHVELRIPAGYWTDSSNSYELRPCPLGYYSADANVGACTICPIGYMCPYGSNEPILCMEGAAAASQGMHECTPCGDNEWYNPSTKACETKTNDYFTIHPIFAEQNCLYNQQSDTTSMSNSAYVDCVPNDGNYYIKSSTSYAACPSGFYCKEAGQASAYIKIPCPPGTYAVDSTTGRQTIQDACLMCPAGSYCPGGDQPATTCPAGYVCPEGTLSATQYPCPIFSMNANTGGQSYADCGACTSGKKCLEGTSTAFDCPPGENCGAAPWNAGDCASGTYSLGGVCTACPAGQWCPTAASYGMKCPSGTYTASTGSKSPSDCQLSAVDSPVPKYGMTAAPTDYPLALGYSYPAGTAFSHQLPCPAGQICDANTAARSWSDCPADYACPQGSATSTALNCERGYVCNAKSVDPRQTPQPSGTYSTAVGESPITCPAGFYCPKGTIRPRSCPLGYYCESGTEDYRDTPCPNGNYGESIELTASGDCTACPAGYFCQPGLALPQLCPKGTFSTGSADSAFTTSGLGYSTPCTLCTAGYYCPNEGTPAAIECGNGFFSPEGSVKCFPCYAGHLCDSTTTTQAYMEANKCDGVECLTYAIYETTTCPAGYYCDPNEFQPLPCPVGTYQDPGTSQGTIATCKDVPAGYYNDEVGQVLAQVQKKLCAPGFICAAGAISAFDQGCAPGKYVTQSGQTTCSDCPAGYYCLGNTAYPIPCPAGYYCEQQTSNPIACPIGKFGATTKLESESQCTTCTKGSYCAEPGANQPTGLCNAGYYCNTGSIVPQENDCPAGSYCEQGSFEGKQCPQGYYNPNTNMKTFQDCALCTPGQYCDGTNPTSTSGNCIAGYYCEAGSRVNDQFAAQPGYYTLEGAAAQVACPVRTYNPFYYQDSCTTCDAGFYCPNTAMTEPIICPVGYYCEAGYESPVQCPVGTYNPVTGGTSIATHCLDCPPGRYCATKGLSAPSGDCNAGYFCLVSAETNKPSALDIVASRWGKCRPGSYCPIGTAHPYPCPAGTFSDQEQLGAETDCTDCTAGSYCLTRNLTAVTGQCDEGFYCPAGQIEPRNDAYKCTAGYYCPQGSAAKIECAAGTYQHQDYQAECLPCPKGYYCPTGSQNPIICPAGSYCVANSATHEPCPLGKYMPDTGASAQCLDCPPGYACRTTGLSAATELCDAGYWCKSGAYLLTPTSLSQGGGRCQVGYYCPQGSGMQLKCLPGYACPNAGMSDTDLSGSSTYECQAGYFCQIGATQVNPTSSAQGGGECPTGHYCPQKTDRPIPCVPGTYRNTNLGQADTDCAVCPVGNYCKDYGSVTYEQCDEGWYCENDGTIGETSPTPWDSTNSVAKICPAGHYCTAGQKYACQNKYQDEIGSTSCKNCPAGYQCTTEVMSVCGNNNYCPSGQMLPTKCADGYYTLKTTASASSECVQCPKGYTCGGDDSAGYYTGAAQIALCPETYYCPAGTRTATTLCSAGYYCPEGAFEMVPCPAGYYCDGTGNSFSSKTDCTAGYYCPGGTTSTDMNNLYQCAAGHYCPLNSHDQKPCDIGTYNPDTGSTDSSACLTCPSGQTCSSRGMSAPDTAQFSCEAGYYCPTNTEKYMCPVGYYCKANQYEPTECAVGEYSWNQASSECTKCPAGFYCGDDVIESFANYQSSNVLSTEPIPCMAGQYCPKGSYLITSTSLAGTGCPIGTFNPNVGGRNAGDCINCPEGYLCSSVGLADSYADLAQCTAGFYCPGASISKSAISCPVGAYCPQGSVYFIECPAGTYNDNVEQSSDSNCLSCPVDYYCPSKGMTSTGKVLCGDGHECTGGTSVSTPMSDTGTGDFCPEGHYCSRQFVGKQECPIGTYQPNTGQSQCINCPAGYLCDSTAMTVPNECPEGFYCVAKTASIAEADYGKTECPAGTYNDIKNIGAEEDCTPCPVGKWCPAQSTSQSDASDCDETFFCPYGSASANGYTNDYEFGFQPSGKCPPGYTCPAGTLAPVPCEVGTFQALSGQTSCDSCTAGYYCDEKGMSTLDENQYCDAGYYCEAGSDVPNPELTPAIGDPTGQGNICQKGFYCPKGSATPTQCAAGTYEPRTGSAECQECPAGYYCEIECFQPIECQEGYCPAGSGAPTLCPDGQYGSESLKKLESEDDCPFCPNGQYCNSGIIQGQCDAGYWCDFGAAAFRDSSKICEAGHYCPAGTDLPVRCPETLYFAGTGATDVSYCQPCQAGYYCLDNDSVSRVCPKGHFCGEKTKEPIPCFEGTYNPYKRMDTEDDCIACPAGTACNVKGIDDYTKYMCPAGHYCPRAGMKDDPIPCRAGTYRNATGAASEDECWECPEGHYCEEGATFYTPCDAGYYCPAGSEKQEGCRPGTYCPAMSSEEIPCPKGYHCPNYQTDIYTKCRNGTYCGEGQIRETKCKAGSFGTGVTDNWNETVSCIPCGPGQYSDAQSQTCLPCEAGYICFEGATTSRPNNPAEFGQICDAGFYCPKGAITGIACPVGTFSNEKGNGQLNQCKPCPANTYGNSVGQTECTACQGYTVSEIGSTTCRCAGLNRKYLAQVGQCVCLSGYEPVDGSSSLTDGLSDCQKIIYNACASDEERDITGKCRKKDDCAAECNGGPGTLQQNFGICQCENIVTTQQICNIDCQNAALQTTFTSEGKIRIYDPVSKNSTEADLPNTIGSAKCSKDDATKCELVGVGLSDSGSFQGNYDLPPSLTENDETLNDLNNRNVASRRQGTYKKNLVHHIDYNTGNTTLLLDDGRRLQSLGADATVISNPVVCTTSGSAMLFDSLSEEKYPVYVKDSLLNTNNNFDYGDFTALPALLKGLSNQNFIFTFEEAGIYVFADNRDPSKLMIISVMADNQDCPANSKFSPMTYASLLKVGAYREEILLPPDWTFFFLNLFAFIGLVTLSVICVTCIARRDWRQKYIPAIKYQKQHYQNVDIDDPADKRAIVSINTDSSSFMFRAQGHDDGEAKDLGQKLNDGVQKKKKTKHQRSRTDLSLNQVENLKDSLHKHLKDIKKLRALRYGKDGGQVQDELGNDVSDYTSESEEDLNMAISNVKKLILNTKAVLKGEGQEEIQIFTEDTKMLDSINNAEQMRQEREEAIKVRKEELEENQRIQEEKFKRKINTENQHQIQELEDMKNKVLEMQVESAYDRGKQFQERLIRDGQREDDAKDMMDQLENKMQRVEDMLVDDKDRQNDMLRRQLEQRRLRRRKLNEKLAEVDEQLHKQEYKEVDEKNQVVLEMQEELKQEIEQLEQEDKVARQDVTKKFDAIKIDKLADYQEKLRNSGGTKDFQNILDQYQLAQLQVDRELKRQIDKENDKLDRELKARKARAKAQAELRRNQKFKDLEQEQQSKAKEQVEGKKKIQEALSTSERKDEILDVFSNNLKMKINDGNQLVTEMEKKRRDEEALRQQHEREQRKVQGEAMKDAATMNRDVEDEIERLQNFNSYEPFQALVNERSSLQKQLQVVQTDEERQFLLNQLHEVDDSVKNQLGQEAKDQDAALKRMLEKRRMKRNKAIEKERLVKEEQLQKRIDYALQNSTDFAIRRNELTLEAFDKIIGQMKLELTPEEIPATLENLIDDKHQKELSDWLLKLYEQKAIELKEEILTMMEEKVAKQAVLKKNCEDRKKGIDAIIARTDDPAARKELEQRKQNLDNELNREVNKLETYFVANETKKTREIQERSMDRETKALQEMSEMHFAEKQKIFEQYLPDSLMKDLYDQLAAKEREDMELYKKELAAIKEAKLKEMQEEEMKLQAELAEQQSKLNKLSAEEAAIAKKEFAQKRREQQAQREKQAVVNSQDVIEKIRADMEKGLEGLSGAYDDEHKRQLAMMEERMQKRSKLVQEALEAKKLEALRKAEQAELEKQRENDKIRDARKRKTQLTETISSNQKLILKGCYSRPLYNYNKKLHDQQVKNNDIAQLLNQQSLEIKEQVMNRLLKKVTDLEEKVTTDATKKVDRRQSLFQRLQTSIANKAGASTPTVVSDTHSAKSSDRVSSAKQALNSLLKKK